MMNQVLFGIDVFCTQLPKNDGSRYGLLTNDVAATIDGIPARQALLKAGLNIVTLFSPEHGLSARGEDGAGQQHHTDRLTGLPVFSLYGEHLAPPEAAMTHIDAVIFDIPDVGCRFYTYLWTMTYLMEACARYNKRLIILDRPNPLGGNINKAEGPWLDEARCASFIGRWNIPLKHGCTLGELALFFAATHNIHLDLQVIPVRHWNRNQTAEDAGWPFVPTSPAIQDIETAMLYPGMGLLEGINVNEGRGAAFAFKMMGAPWIDAATLQHELEALQLPGFSSEISNFIPVWGMYAGERCYGLQFSVSDPRLFEPVRTGLALTRLLVQLFPGKCRQRLYPTVANPSGEGHLDKLTGVYDSLRLLQTQQFIQPALQKEWAAMMQPWILY